MRKKMLMWFPLLFAGCATPYVEPTGPDTASLAIQNITTTEAMVQAFQVGEDCSGGKLKLNGDSKLVPGKDVNVKVKADQAFSFYVNYSRDSKYCLMPGTFTPKPGERYVARFGATKDKCYLAVLRMTPAGEK